MGNAGQGLESKRRNIKGANTKTLGAIFLPVAIVAVAFSLITSFRTEAANVTWTNTAGGGWNTAANWSPNQVPGINDIAIITNTGAYTVNLDMSPTVSGFMLGASNGVTTQAFSMNSQTFTLNGPGTVTAHGVFNFNGGILNCSNILTVDGVCNWSAGIVTGPSPLMIDSGATVSMSSSSEKDVRAGVIVNAGMIAWTGGPFYLWNNGVFTNLAGGVFDMQSDAALLSYGTDPNVFYNYGTFRKSAGNSTAVATPFVNNGTLDAQTGVILFNYYGANYTFNSGSSFIGAGTNQLVAGATTMNGTIYSSNLVIAGGTVTGTYTVSGLLTFNSGYLNGPGVVTIATNSTLLVNAPQYLEAQNGIVIVNAGTVTWTSGDFYLEGQSVFTNLAGALFDAQTDKTLRPYSFDPNVFYNFGTFRKSAGAGITTIATGFVNSGIVDAQTGQVVIQSGGPLVFNSGSSLTGAGTTYLSAGTCTMNGNINSVNLVIAGGTVTGTYAVAGTLTFNSGKLNGPGIVTIATNGSLMMTGTSDKEFIGNTIVNAGTVTWTDGNFFLESQSVFTNLAGAVFDVRTDKSLLPFAFSPNVFFNFGTFRKSAGAGTTAASIDFVNAGMVSAQSGALFFSGGYTNPTGALSVSGGSAIQIAQPLVLPSGFVTGNGTIQAPSITSAATVSPGSTNAVLTLSGSFTQLYNGSMEFDIGGTSPGVNQSQVNVTGAAKLDGRIALRFSPGYVPAVNSSNLVLTAGSRTGQFPFQDHFYLLGQNKRIVPVYGPTNLVLTTISATDPTNFSLSTAVRGQTFALAWPSEFTGYYLVTKTNLDDLNWTSVPGVTNFYMETPMTSPHKFFRLFQAP